MALSLHHKIAVADARAHLLEVETTVRADGPLPSPLVLFMPVWTPGSYLVREFARHVEGLSAVDGQATKVRKNAWSVTKEGATSVTVRYRLYCNDLTVRTNHLDETHAFLNGAATFLAVEGHEGAPATIELSLPEGWRVATSLAKDSGGRLHAPDLDTLVDCPLELGQFRELPFQAVGKPHTLAVWPSDVADAGQLDRLVGDIRAILESEARLFGGALPYERYLLLLHLCPRGRGGLEHNSSCALLANPACFSARDGYLDLLSLVAHEVFHTWNVKRIRPAGLWPYRYQEENYTRLLWWFEGATSYYDWRTLRTSKLCTIDEYLDHLASEIALLDATFGRHVHSLEEASFDAWIKLYRPDENTANSSVSYYRKGEIVCALLDLELRGRTAGRVPLDAVLAHLWERFGSKGVPVPEGGMQEIVERVAEVDLSDVFDRWIQAPGEVDYAPTLARAGLALERVVRDPHAPKAWLGMRARSEGARVFVGSVLRGGAAQRGGLDPGDEILAIGNKRVEGGVDAALSGLRPKDEVQVVVARDGRIATRTLTLDETPPDRVRLVARPNATSAERALFTAWLGDPHPAWGSP